MFRIVLLDKEGYTIHDNNVDTFGEAKELAKYYLTDDWAIECETTHEELDTHKVEIRNHYEVLLWDIFYKN